MSGQPQEGGRPLKGGRRARGGSPEVRGLLELARPLNMAIGFVAVVVGAIVAGPLRPISDVLRAALSASLILGGGNSLNDLCDLEEDRRNRPSRPIPSGRTRPMTAGIWAGVLFASGLSVALPLGRPFLVALSAVGLLVLYDVLLKRLPLVGNLAVALLGGTAFLYGGMAVGRIEGALVPAVLAFLLHLGRELIKDAEDVEGDREAGARTLAVVHGRNSSLRWASGTLLLTAVLAPLPFLLGMYSWPYVVVVLLGVDPVLAYVVYILLGYPDGRTLGRLSRILKANMLLGLAALVAGR
ncbi:MAG TPA: geranylgeranylglycerol-phosphate geranylgeranyltransferase [Candidatus Latescibacteria bacterium]|nr:geranylgeranylglycerol-phosphate geranylgeranyltransferase [Candidatus Latescibacterota bacterium]